MKCSSKRKTVSEADWRAAHAAHGQPVKSYLKEQPPAGYRLFCLVCACGATHVCFEEPDAKPVVMGEYTIHPNGLVDNHLVKLNDRIVATGLTFQGACDFVRRQSSSS